MSASTRSNVAAKPADPSPALARPSIPSPRLSAHGARQRKVAVQCAAELFDGIGYHETRMEEIAAAAGLRKSALYHYFSAKHDLLVSIHEEFMAALDAQLDERTRAGLGPLEFLRGVVEDIIRTVDSYPHHVRVFFEHYRDLPEPARSDLRATRDRYAARVQEVIVAGMEAGYFARTDARLAMLAFFGVCNWCYTWYRPGGELGAEEVADFLWQFALGGLTGRVPAAAVAGAGPGDLA